ncbi:MAG: L,D-transpeptidase family protein [Candidatus Desulfatibia sp.]
MGNMVKRKLFIMRTQLSVAYSNYVVNRTFASTRDGLGLHSNSVRIGIAMAVLVLAGTLFGSSVFIGKSSANIPPAITAEKALSVESVVTPPQITSIPEIPAPEDIVPEETAPPAPDIEPRFAIAVEKSTQTLFILKDNGETYEVVEKFDVSLGKILGVKEIEGDLRTPEGFYKVVEIKMDEELPEIYGPRAFVLNYPNEYDVAMGRTGGGIWLHGSGQGEKTPDTRGCVELDDDNILALEYWLKIDTLVAIFNSDIKLPFANGKLDKKYLKNDFFYAHMAGVNAG